MSSFRDYLILFNAILLGGFLVFIFVRYLGLKRNPEPHEPQNLEPFFDDEVLEGPHLERVLGVALAALVIAVVALIAYFVWEPFRGADAVEGFDERSVERGAVLFANSESPNYDATRSLLCADCHGVDGGGGSKAFIVKSEDPRCDPKQTVNDDLAKAQPYCLPQQVAWAAPNLKRAPLIYSRAQLTNIITYGRPGTPMPAWGIASGKGVLNAQGIQDLVNYVESISMTPEQGKRLVDKTFADMKDTLAKPAVRAAAQKWVSDQTATLAAARALAVASPTSENLENVDYQQQILDVAQQWLATTQRASDGQVLFMTNCARCHTRGWSWFDPENPQGNPPPGKMGGGAFGPNLTDGDVNGQFPPPNGDAQLLDWITAGVPANQGYGIRGISSGRMPHFGAILTDDQVEAIMAYERSL